MQSVWRVRGSLHRFDRKSMIMGILNVTPDSFSDGGKYVDPEAAIRRGLQMVEEGAAILDIGGESTRPGSDQVLEEEELARVIPVIRGIRKKSSVWISVDTMKANVARVACEAGADIINDVNGLRCEKMVQVAAETQAAVVVMHMKGEPKTMQTAPYYEDIVKEVRGFFTERMEELIRHGIKEESISLDPGIGFGKTLFHNLSLLKHLDQLRIQSRPLVLGLSKKTMFGQILETKEVDQRAWGTVASTAWLKEAGVEVIRVHDVKSNSQALRMSEAILG